MLRNAANDKLAPRHGIIASLQQYDSLSVTVDQWRLSALTLTFPEVKKGFFEGTERMH